MTHTISLLWLVPAFVVAAHATATAAVEDQAAYQPRCKREVIAQEPRASAQADSICSSYWEQIVTTGPMAEALLSLAPATGATFDPAIARKQATAVKWRAKPLKGFVASGQLKDIDVGLTRTPVLGAQFDWFKNGEPIPFNLEQALRVRDAGLTMIACLAFGATESTQVFRVAAPGKTPFGLTIGRREAAVASQSSTFGVVADFSGRMPSLAMLRKDGNEWASTCPQ